MGSNERQEFIIMLLIEKKTEEDQKFYDWLYDNFNIEAFNERYKELLDDFLNRYALDTTEKSAKTN